VDAGLSRLAGGEAVSGLPATRPLYGKEHTSVGHGSDAQMIVLSTTVPVFALGSAFSGSGTSIVPVRLVALSRTAILIDAAPGGTSSSCSARNVAAASHRIRIVDAMPSFNWLFSNFPSRS